MKKFLFALVGGLFFSMSAVSAASLSTMESYLDRYCGDIDPVRNCGTYQDDIDDARDKVARLHTLLNKYDASTTNAIIGQLVDQFSDVFDTSSSTRIKILAAYYTLSLGQAQESFDTDDVIAYLFDDVSTTRTSYQVNTSRNTRTVSTTTSRYNRYAQTSSARDGTLRSFSGIGSNTRVNTSRREITVSGKAMEVRIRALDDDGNSATLNEGYRVVAEINNRTYAATYDRNGDRSFRFGDRLRQGNDITFSLVCKVCTSGTRYYSNTALDGWYVVDEETFEIRGNLSSSSSYSSRYTNYDRNYDLALRDIEWEYDIHSRDVDVRLTTTVRNEGDYDNVLEELTYTIEVDNDRLSSREYDIRHIETDCDDSYVNRYDDEDIDIDENDECEITVEITLDRDDTEDEYVEIEVELEADRDDYSSNDSDTVRFRVD